MSVAPFIKLSQEQAIKKDFKDFLFAQDSRPSGLLEKMFHYYLINALEPNKDCDNLPVTKNIYRRAYNHLRHHPLDDIYGDTLHSFHMTFKFFMQKFRSGTEVIDKDGNIQAQLRTQAFKRLREQYGIGGKRANRLVWYYVLKDVESELDLPEQIIAFGHLTHSIGNFMPVPRSFNTARFVKTTDLWFTAMYHIYRYYQNKGTDAELLQFLQPSATRRRSVIAETKGWLSHFHSWANFVTSHFLNDFLLEPANPASKPRVFFNYKNDQLRQDRDPPVGGTFFDIRSPDSAHVTEAHFLTYLNFVNQVIVRRGARIVKNIQ